MSTDSYVYRERIGSDANAPLLFLFHGTGGDEDQFFDIGGHLLPGGHLIAIRGDVSERGALRYFKRSGEGVYDMADFAERTGKMAGFVAAHIGEKRPSAVYGFGYSNGANILAAVLFERPELFDGAVLMHPLIPFGAGRAPRSRRASTCSSPPAGATRLHRRPARKRSRGILRGRVHWSKSSGMLAATNCGRRSLRRRRLSSRRPASA